MRCCTGPPSSDWLSLSEALVNVRATLAAAEAADILDTAAAAAILRAAKALFYKERRWKDILAASEDVEPAVLARLADWLAAGRVDRKREDAYLLLERVRALLTEEPSPADETSPFEHTQIWDEIAGEIGARCRGSADCTARGRGSARSGALSATS